MDSERWIGFRAEGQFAVNAPLGSQLVQVEERLFQLKYPDEFRTSMFIGQYYDQRFPMIHLDRLESILVDHTQRFAQQAIWTNRLTPLVPMDIEAERLKDGVLVRGFFVDSKDAAWVLRCYAGINRKHYWVYHWNGPQSVMRRFVFRSIESWTELVQPQVAQPDDPAET